MNEQKKVTLGIAIDVIIETLSNLDDKNQRVAISAALQALNIKTVIGISELDAREAQKSPSNVSLLETDQGKSESIVDIRTLKNQKSPSSLLEMAALVAYYLQYKAPDENKKEIIGAEDLDKYFKQAGYPLPKRIEQVLLDAKGAGYFDQTGRGAYKLNPVGYNLVVHSLPRKSIPKKAPGVRSIAPKKGKESTKSEIKDTPKTASKVKDKK